MIRLLRGDCRETLATLEPGSVQACITSPPYWGLRSYGTPDLVWADGWLGSLGLEPDPGMFVAHIVECFRAVRRVLRDDGVLWVNMGDSYAGSGKGYGGGSFSEKSNHVEKMGGSTGSKQNGPNSGLVAPGYKAKDLMEIPSMVAQALRADGWYLRSRIPWLKRNAMPESVTDRPASSIEYVFLLSKSARYFWDPDAVRQPHARLWDSNNGGTMANIDHEAAEAGRIHQGNNHRGAYPLPNPAGRNRRNGDWFFESWQGLLLDEDDAPLALVVNPAPLKIAHYASFPPKLVEPMVKASTSEKGCCPECGAPWVRVTGAASGGTIGASWHPHDADEERGNFKTKSSNGYQPGATVGWRPSCGCRMLEAGCDGMCQGSDCQLAEHRRVPEPVPQTILDPFAGAGTTLMVADRLGRSAIGCELSESYSDMGTDRIVGDAPLFVEMGS